MSTAREIIVGIDLGTTFSAIAYVDEDGRPTIIQVEGENTIPSVVLFDGPVDKLNIVVGKSAMIQAEVKRDRVVRWIKRSMGEEYIRSFSESRGNDAVTREFTPEEISAEILRKIVKEAQAELGQPIKKAVITCPAWFDDKARKATEKAGQLAGLEVLRIVNEPTAAAIYYGLEKLNENETVLVYDLGGGTFDSSILRFKGGEFDHVMSVGDRKLGGHDWTEILVKNVAERLAEQFGENPTLDPQVKQHLYEKCEQAKRDLARMPSVTIACVYKGKGADVTVTQAEFEEWTEGRLAASLHRTQECVNKAGMTWADINHILLVGGSTRLRRVPEALAELAGKAPIRTGQEDVMVALGAATLTAKEVRVGKGPRAKLRAPRIKERTHRPLGLVTLAKDKDYKFANALMIKANEVLPAENTRADFKTLVNNQDVFDVAVLQGENPNAEKNVINKTYRFKCVPGTPKGSGIAVTFAYDASNIISVKAKDVRTSNYLQCEEVQFQWPQGGGKRLVDICFVVDCTGSMGGCISGVKQEIANFCNELTTSEFDHRLSLVAYRDLKCGEPTSTFNWTTDLAQFRTWVGALIASGGGDEPESGLDGLMSASEMPPRSDASHVVVLVTDATSHVPDQKGRSAEAVARALKEKEMRVFAIAPRFPAYETIVNETGGKLWDFNARFRVGAVDASVFRDVLHDVGKAVISTLLTVED